MKIFAKRLLVFLLTVTSILSIYSVPTEAAGKTTLQNTQIALPISTSIIKTTTIFNIYNVTDIPKWTIKDTKIADLGNNKKTASGSSIQVYANKIGNTTLTAKVGKKTYTAKVIVYDSKKALKNVSYSVKKVSDSVFSVTMNNKNSYPVYFIPGIQYYDKNYKKGSLHNSGYDIPAKTKITRYFSAYNTFVIEKSASNSILRASLVKTKNKVSAKVDKLDYSWGTSRANVTITNKNSIPISVNLSVLFYDENGRIVGVGDHTMSYTTFDSKVDPNGTYKLDVIPGGLLDSKTNESIKSCKVVIYSIS